MFEIKYRDAAGRIGLLHMRKKKLETPLVLPVINPKSQQVPPKEIKKIGFEGVITNSYLIHKNMKEAAEKKGIHRLLGFDGVVMTDSGSYQLYEYGSVEVGHEQIVKFQNSIGSDIGVMLDIPTPPDVSYEKASSDLDETLRRAEASVKIKKCLLTGTVQGSTHLRLREKSAREIGKLDFDVYAIGGVVPLMESYRFSELAGIIARCKKFLPLHKPVHLFGCGHPMIFALVVASGCDMFDSAAYSLYARNGRYLTAEGTLRLEEMRELPCSCEVCRKYSPSELNAADEKEKLLALHNLHATFQEIKRVKQSIYDGSLWELAETRARSHPSLIEALKITLEQELLEKFDPVTKKSAFFYSGPESLMRPEVRRHLKKLDEIKKAKKLVLLPDSQKPYAKAYGISSNADYHVCIVSPVFGIIPIEIEEVYPLNQHDCPTTLDAAQLDFMKKHAKEYAKNFDEVFISSKLKFLGMKGKYFDETDQANAKEDVKTKMLAIADYQFGRGAGDALFENIASAEVVKTKTGRIRRIFSNKKLTATLRASDGFLILTSEGAEKLLKLAHPRNRVVVSEDAVDFVKEGKSVFAKFVEDCDRSIKPYQEVVVVDKDDNLLATGTSILNGEEMLVFKKGVAVKVRHANAIAKLARKACAIFKSTLTDSIS